MISKFMYVVHHIFTTNIENLLTLLHSERPKLRTILAFLSDIGLNLYIKG